MAPKLSHGVRLLCASLIFTLAVTACKSTESQLLGKWEQVDQSSNIIEFFKDGTVLFGGATLNYKVLDDSHLRLDSLGIAQTLTFSLSGDNLTLTYLGSTSIFRRANNY